MAEKNMNNFIPKNAVKLCNRCQNRNRGEVGCKMFPKRIPHEVLVGDIICKKYLPIEEK